MNAIENMLLQLQKLDFAAIGQEVLVENLDTLADLNVAQLEQGLGADGQPLTPGYRSDEYAALKNNINSVPGLGTPDLKAKGDFHGSIYAKEAADGAELLSSDSKADELLLKYGERVLGLTDESKQTVSKEYMLPRIAEEVKRKLTT